MNSNIILLVLFAAMLAAVPASRAVPPIPNGHIVASASPANTTVGQTVTVTCRMFGYDGTAEIDSVNFNVSYDTTRLAFVDGSFNTGSSSGSDQQWLSKTNQEAVANGFQFVNYSDGSLPGTVFVTIGDLGPSSPERGTLAPNGFLISFQFRIIASGSATISFLPALDESVLLDTFLRHRRLRRSRRARLAGSARRASRRLRRPCWSGRKGRRRWTCGRPSFVQWSSW